MRARGLREAGQPHPQENGLGLPLPTSRHQAHPKGPRWRPCTLGRWEATESWKGSAGEPSSIGRAGQRAAHLPTIVHSHEISDQQEGVGQHAHRNLKPERPERQSSHPPQPRHTMPAPCTKTCLHCPRWASAPPSPQGRPGQLARLTPITNLV